MRGDYGLTNVQSSKLSDIVRLLMPTIEVRGVVMPKYHSEYERKGRAGLLSEHYVLPLNGPGEVMVYVSSEEAERLLKYGDVSRCQ